MLASLPGLGLAYLVCHGGFALAEQITRATDVPLSGVPVAIVLGAAVNNAVTIPQTHGLVHSPLHEVTKPAFDSSTVFIVYLLSHHTKCLPTVYV